jgi:mRNA interferase MazF
MQRCEIWWAELGPPAGRRPVVLLSRDESYSIRELITVAPVTTRIRQIASEVPLGMEDGLPKPCVINLDTITTIAKASLREKLTTLSLEKQKAVESALHFALGMECNYPYRFTPVPVE